MKYLKLLIVPILSLALFACSASQQQAFLSNAPSIIQGTLATASDLFAAYSAANQQLNGKSLNPTTGLAAAQSAYGSLASSNLSTAVTNVFEGLNALGTSLKASGASPAQVVAAQSAQIVAAQVATQAAVAPAGNSTTLFQVHYNRLTHLLVITKVTPFSPRA